MSEILSKLQSLVVTDVDYDELEKLDDPCPSCGNNTLHVDAGGFINVYRCSNCRHEGAGPQW